MNKIFPRNRVVFSRDNFLKIRECYKKGQTIEGPDISVFEKMFASYIGTKYAVSFSSARSGLLTFLDALSFQPGDEIIFPAYTFHVIPAIVKSLGLKPVFVDVRNDTYTINTSLIKSSITKKTKAIFATHILGHPCDMDDIMALSREYDLKVIEDCAHACGAEYKGQKVGSFGIAGIFSFG
ncbi:MAG: aminotransferase class I/II-fold pyridoxal phosphate-dependent enzyme, partial [Candidatus Omnitrophica bacterium]|nr:aminotransferase class I/II-fold pyridoxal phosphate-dependent enzyme [Candidatus Omnitrophota bacterium]